MADESKLVKNNHDEAPKRLPLKDSTTKQLSLKSGNQCAFPDCKRPLYHSDSMIGEICHIEDAKPGGRWNPNNTNEDNRKEENLIFLCPEHHKLTDDTEKYSVDVLKAMKYEHEKSIEQAIITEEIEERNFISLQEIDQTNSLSVEEVKQKYYSTFVNQITSSLQLNSWHWVSSNGCRCILPKEVVDGANSVCEKVDRAVWPNGFDNLREVIINLKNHLYTYLQHYMSRAEYYDSGANSSGYFKEDKSWKKTCTDKYDKYAEESRVWQDKTLNLFFNVIVALNEYANEVRNTVDPNYFLEEGKFTLIDEFGNISNGIYGTYYIPENYIEIE